ncbi:mechanosensitive ion channel family protein [Fluviicola chungangensis]|uniref:Mechanosensitive ion channel family protein n=1 Tax=Fluviicola chungangensis TaxID=2597671 RepID=A0A556N0W3_9FLAO|nr:mechanosensitive ion channel family protein [Fluviicola chungangensis]TSJ45669.1 mechanosensitive ion channel family protein [Fluviicola chungangensis]
MKKLLAYHFLGNSLYAWIVALGIALGTMIVIKLFSLLVIRKIKAHSIKTVNTWDDHLIDGIERFVIPVLYISAVYFSIYYLQFTVKIRFVLHTAYLVVFTYFSLRVISSIFKKIVSSFVKKNNGGIDKMEQANGLIIVVNVLIWFIGILFLFDNLGYDITTLLAGLGIGGIAIALAAQAILGDLFSYFVIFFDRPFEIGDFIIVDDKSGTIEQIGIKTTRIRTLGGEQLVCSNTDLTNSRVHNYKRLEKRRIVFQLGVTYQTSHDQLKQIPGMVKSIIESEQDVEYERGNFSGFGDSSLNFEFVYHVLSTDFDFYMDKQEKIYLGIYGLFEQLGIEFAYPTQTLFVHSEKPLSPETLNA